MTIKNKIKCCANFTSTENQIGKYILQNKDEIQNLPIQ